jgi:VWFA-related protein
MNLAHEKETTMTSPNRMNWLRVVSTFFLGLLIAVHGTPAQQPQTIAGPNTSSNPGRPVTVPLTITVKESGPEPELQNIDLVISEDGEPQSILSIRGTGTNSPMTIAVLIQEDVVSSVANEIKSLAEFVRGLPKGSRVMVGYLRTGSLQVKQKFTTDLDKSAKALRPPVGLSSVAPYNPYVEVIEALKRFDSQPLGRRAILLVSDGLDTSRGVDSSGPTQSIDLQRAVTESQRRGVAIYGFYAPTVASQANILLASNAQSSLLRLATETGGHAYFQGTGAPVSFDPFLRELDSSLDRQAALTYLSTHLNKGFHRIAISSATPGVRVAYPTGYVR